MAWHPLGWSPAWFAEIEAFPSAVLAHHYPGVPNLGDMTAIAARIAAGETEAPDILVGGTPCQAFSVAGLRGGLSDARGQLTISYVELANAIDAARAVRGERPAITVWENVPGVLSSKDNAFGCFLGALAGEDCELQPPGKKWADAGCVFGPQRAVAWRVLDAQYFGLAQRRRRVFVVSSAREGFDPAALLFEFDGLRRDTAPSREPGQNAAAGTLRSTDGGSDVDHARAGHLVPAGGLAFGGNNQSGPIDVATARNACASASGRMDFETETFVVQPPALSVALRGREGGATAELGDDLSGCLRASGGGGDKAHVLAPIAFSCKDHGADAASDLSPTMRAMGHAGSHANAGGQLAVAWALGSHAGAADGETTNKSHASGGPVGSNISEELAYSLRAGRNQSVAIAFDSRQDPVSSEHLFGALGSSSPQAQAVAYSTKLHNTSSNQAGKLYEEYTVSLDASSPPPALVSVMAVRRLTPVECERLQGFPDGYTMIPWRKKSADDCPDGPRYKALGNSMATTVMAWIGRRIARGVAGGSALQSAGKDATELEVDSTIKELA